MIFPGFSGLEPGTRNSGGNPRNKIMYTKQSNVLPLSHDKNCLNKHIMINQRGRGAWETKN